MKPAIKVAIANLNAEFRSNKQEERDIRSQLDYYEELEQKNRIKKSTINLIRYHLKEYSNAGSAQMRLYYTREYLRLFGYRHTCKKNKKQSVLTVYYDMHDVVHSFLSAMCDQILTRGRRTRYAFNDQEE